MHLKFFFALVAYVSAYAIDSTNTDLSTPSTNPINAVPSSSLKPNPVHAETTEKPKKKKLKQNPRTASSTYWGRGWWKT